MKEEGRRKKEEGRIIPTFPFSCFSFSFFSSASEAEPLDIDSRAEPGS
jgi:hypothetical protein